MKKILVAACCAFASLPAVSGDWFFEGVGNDSARFVDYSSIEKHENVRGAWTISIYNRNKNGINYMLTWREYDCQSKKIRQLDYVAYDFSGEILKSGNGNGAWIRVPPGSIGAESLRNVCENDKPEIIFDNKKPDEVAKKFRDFLISIGEWK